MGRFRGGLAVSCTSCSCCGVTVVSVRGLVRWQACGAAGDVDRHREADADEDVLVGRVVERRDDPDHAAVAIEQGPTRVAGVDGGVDLDEAVDGFAAGRRVERPVEAGDDARRHRSGEPERVADDEGLVADPGAMRVTERRGRDVRRHREGMEEGGGLLGLAGGMFGGIVSGWRTAMSFSGCRATIWAGDSEPSTKVTVIEAASSTTWRLVRMSPRSSTTTPVPIASSWLGDGLGPVGAIAVSIRTTDGRARSYAIEEKAGGGVIDASTSWTPVRTSAGVSARGPGAMTPKSHMPRNAATMPETKGADRRRFARARRQRLRQGRSGGVGWMTAGSNIGEPRMTALETLASWLAVYGEIVRVILRGSSDEARPKRGGTRVRVEGAPSPVLSSLAPKDPGGPRSGPR